MIAVRRRTTEVDLIIRRPEQHLVEVAQLPRSLLEDDGIVFMLIFEQYFKGDSRQS